MSGRFYTYLRDQWTVPVADLMVRMVEATTLLASELNKPLQVRLEGSDGRIEVNLATALVQPVVHLLRNAVDHGIEDAAGGARSGKDRTGTVSLRSRITAFSL